MKNDITTQNPNYKALIEKKLKKQQFMRHIGFDLTTIDAGHIEGEMPIQSHLLQQDDFVHGGVISTIVDIVTGFAAYSLVKPTQKVVTAEIKTSYFKPAVGQSLKAIGWVEKPGSRYHFCEGEVYTIQQNKNQRVAKATTTMAVLTPQNKG